MSNPFEVRQSGTVRFLQGKLYPGYSSPIKDITASGNTRVVHLKDGTMIPSDKRQVALAFQASLKVEGYQTAVRSIRKQGDGVVAKIGGAIMGRTENYQSKARAIAALKKRYGQTT